MVESEYDACIFLLSQFLNQAQYDQSNKGRQCLALSATPIICLFLHSWDALPLELCVFKLLLSPLYPYPHHSAQEVSTEHPVCQIQKGLGFQSSQRQSGWWLLRLYLKSFLKISWEPSHEIVFSTTRVLCLGLSSLPNSIRIPEDDQVQEKVNMYMSVPVGS